MISIKETEKSWPFTVDIDEEGYLVARDPKTGRIECCREQAVQLAAALYHFAQTGELPE